MVTGKGNIPEFVAELSKGQPDNISKAVVEELIERETWRWSKNPMWPHCYLVKEQVRRPDLFIHFAKHIQQYGYVGEWGDRAGIVKRRYFIYDNWVYWIMRTEGQTEKEYPMGLCTILNRAVIEELYDYRRHLGTLPGQRRRQLQPELF